MIERWLRYEVDGDARVAGQDALLTFDGNAVLLGNAGSGKTRLTEWLAERGRIRCTARQLVNGWRLPNLGDAPLIIDALDELPANAETDAIGQVLRALNAAGRPRFLLTCRIEEWRAAVTAEAIREQYGASATRLELLPIETTEAHALLASQVGESSADAAVDRFAGGDAGGLLGNPQTLTMLAKVLRTRGVPETLSQVFEQFVEITWSEHSDRRPNSALVGLRRDDVLDALGAAFAALILSGAESVWTGPAHEVGPARLPVAETAGMPGAAALGAALKSRLCDGREHAWGYPHRRIGEYLGARWLAESAGRSRQRKRVLGLLRENGIVPASLRGLHAWLATHGDAELRADVIAADPLGVIANGDADALDDVDACGLLEALRALAARDPHFGARWDMRAGALGRGRALNAAWPILAARGDDDGTVRLRTLLARQMGREAVAKHGDAMRAMLMDEDDVFVVRSAIADALVAHDAHADWPALLDALSARGTEDACRLAVELMDDVGFERLGAERIARLVLAMEGVPPFGESRGRGVIGTLYALRRNLPPDMLDGVLDALAAGLAPFADQYDVPFEEYQIRYLIGDLVAQRLQRPLPHPLALYRWLRPLSARRGVGDEDRRAIAAWVAANPEGRRSIQRHALLDAEGKRDPWDRAFHLRDALDIWPTEEDVVALLDSMAADDERWRDVLLLARRDHKIGPAAIEAAKRLARDADALTWIEEQADPGPPAWVAEQAAREAERQRERQARFAAARASFEAHRDRMRAGEGGVLANPAKAYFRMFHDLPGDGEGHERLATWLSPDLAADALAGFETFLTRDPAPEPSARQIAESYAESRHWPIAWVLVAALAERLRLRPDAPFEGVADERLLAAQVQLVHGLLRDEEGKALSEALDAELEARGLWEAYARLLVEPHLRLRRTHITGLYGLMRDERRREGSARLAAEWLRSHPDLPAEVEEELIDALVRAGAPATLADLAPARLADRTLDERRRLNWQAAWVWADFDAGSGTLADVDDPSLIWALRARFGGRFGGGMDVPVRAAAWIVARFRASHPRRDRPDDVTEGDTNPWDAAEYLAGLAARLAGDPSAEAGKALVELAVAPRDTWTDVLRSRVVDQAATRAEATFKPRTLEAIAWALDDAPPADIDALRDAVLEALEEVQKLVRGDSADPWRGFYADDGVTPKDEEECSDHLVTLLRGVEHQIVFAPEDHMPDDKETDVACSVGHLRLPIEAKGQWHPELWRAGREQLAGEQAIDNRADGRGIYLVYWFGDRGKALTGPPRGTSKAVAPTTPEVLEAALAERLKHDGLDGLRVKVLDLSRP